MWVKNSEKIRWKIFKKVEARYWQNVFKWYNSSIIIKKEKEKWIKKYRCKLASISKRYTKEFLRSVVSYLDNSFESKEDGSIEKFISDNFDSKPSLHDITMMIDIKDTGYKFYNED